jgi:uroporphyrinogen-III synthase
VPIIFISRELKEGSPLRKWAEASEWTMVGHSLISFAPVKFEPLGDEETDWWFFYSPRAVQFAADYLAKEEEPKKRGVRLAVMGPGTAQALRKHPSAFEPDFVGEGSPIEVAEAFGKMARGETVFFPHAKQSRQTVQTLLQDIIKVKAAVCYDNTVVPATQPISADIYVFTSPLNVAAYLDHQELKTGARVIAIGPSTGQALAERDVDFEITEQPGEAWVVALL